MAMDARGPDDPRGLIEESYRMEGITLGECRSIFLDWAMTVPGDPGPMIERLLAGRPAHPMTTVLREGLIPPERTGRRGGRSARTG